MLKFNSIVFQCSIVFFSVLLSIQCNTSNGQNNMASEDSKGEFQCIPCGYDCDKALFDKPGKCPSCKMELVKTATIHFKTIEPTEICNYINAHPNAILLDVRTREEFEGKANPDYGTLKNAINLPIQELEAKISSLNAYKGKEIIVYCSHSHRSPQACYMLTQHGFINVSNMAGGLSVLNDDSCKK